MENEQREIVTVKSMTSKLIGWNLVWGILGSIIAQVLLIILENIIDNITIFIILGLIIDAIVIYFIWKLSISFAFKKYTINYTQVKYFMKNLMIYILIVSTLSCIMNITDINDFDKELENSSELKMANIMSQYLSPEEKAQYDITLAETIKKAKQQAMIYSIVIGIGGIIINVGVFYLNKKNIYAKAVEEQPYKIESE